MSRIQVTFFASLMFLFLLISTGLGFPTSSDGDASMMSLIGRWSEGPCHSLAAMGDILIFHHGGILELKDYANPVAPVILSQTILPFYPEQMCLAGNILAIVHGSKITLIDLDHPANPEITESLTFTDDIRKMGGKVGWLYVLTDDFSTGNGQNLIPINIGDPYNPVLMTPVPLEDYYNQVSVGPSRLVMTHNYGYGVSIFDLSNPATPAYIGQYNHGSSALVSGNLAYVVGNDITQVNLDILDMSGMGDPLLVGHEDWDSLSFDAGYSSALAGSILYVNGSYGGVYACNVADPTAPVFLDGVFVGNDIADRAATSSRLFLALDYAQGLTTINTADPANLAVMGTQEFGKPLYGVTVDFNRAYVSAHEDMVDIIDVTRPDAPVKLGRVDTGDEVWGLDANGHFLYVCNNLHMVNVYDVTDPAAPQLIAYLGSGDYDEFLEEQNGLIFVGGNGGMTIVDARDPYMLSQIAFLDLGSSPRDFAVVGNRLFVISYDSPSELTMFDIENPATPQMIDSLEFEGEGAALAVDNGFATVVIDSVDSDGYTRIASSVKIVDVSGPALTLVSSLPIPTGQVESSQTGKGALVDHGFLYLAAGDMGVLVYDISDPYHPVEYGYYNTGDYATGVVSAFNRIFVADWSDGLYILGNDALTPLGAEAVPAPLILAQNFPNPFNPQTTIAFTLPEQAAVTLRVFDLSGRLVRTLLDGETHTAGNHQVVWNGRDSAGRQVASGAYCYCLEAGSHRETKRMVLIK